MKKATSLNFSVFAVGQFPGELGSHIVNVLSFFNQRSACFATKQILPDGLDATPVLPEALTRSDVWSTLPLLNSVQTRWIESRNQTTGREFGGASRQPPPAAYSRCVCPRG